jgi:hypothetical protein
VWLRRRGSLTFLTPKHMRTELEQTEEKQKKERKSILSGGNYGRKANARKLLGEGRERLYEGEVLAFFLQRSP